MKSYMIHKKYQWIRLLIIGFLLLGAFGFNLYSADVQVLYLCINLIFAAVIIFGLLMDIKFNLLLSIILTVLTPVLCFYLLEGYTHFALPQMAWQIQILNIILYALFFVFMAGLLGNFARAAVATPVIAMLIGLANYYTVSFRQSPILPWDILSLSTALTVTDNYFFDLPGKAMCISLGFIFLALAGSKIQLNVKGVFKRLVVTICSAAAIVLCALGVQTTKAGEVFELDDILFTPNVLYKNNGFVVAFTVNLQYLHVERPAGYRNPIRQELAASYEGEAAEFASIAEGITEVDVDAMPNIIVIMNEAFSDLADITEFATNEDYMPFIHSLQAGGVDNVVSGDLMVSVLGGNTANTEYEFLTGNSMAFLPSGSIAYQQYIKSRIPSMARTLQSLGCYETVAMHPYYASGWERENVYPFMGFEKTFFLEQMRELPYFKGNRGRIRQYISDQAVVDMIIAEYASKNSDKKKFTFAVTMQNHGGYFEEYDNFQPEIELLGVEDNHNKFYTEMYLSLIKKSDTAFENLISYFESYDEPTVIVMFGDHQPGDYVLRSIYDTSEVYTLSEQQKRFITPFVMWANYDIEDEQIGKISANYLQALLFEKAGIPLTGYQKYLSDLRKTLPVLTANILIDKDGFYYVQNEHHPYEELLLFYFTYQYNYVFDAKRRMNTFFGDYTSAVQ